MASSEQPRGDAAMTRSATKPDGELLLGLDTSADAAVALCRQAADGSLEVMGRSRSGDGRRHAETLVPMILDVLTGAAATMPQVGTIVVGTGPAPFTGLRVGLATARSLARARGIEAFGVCSLDALALAAGRVMTTDWARESAPESDLGCGSGSDTDLDSGSGSGRDIGRDIDSDIDSDRDNAREVLVVSDARRREVYYGRYRTGGADITTLIGPAVATPADVAAEHADLVEAGAIFGPALGLYGEILTGPSATDAGTTVLGHRVAPVDPADLVRLALVRRTAGGDLSLTPRYLRRPDVHVAPGRKRATT